MTVLLGRHLRYDWGQASLPNNDHLIFSKGHASPLLNAMDRAVGVIQEDELINNYRRFGIRLEGHTTPILPKVEHGRQTSGAAPRSLPLLPPNSP